MKALTDRQLEEIIRHRMMLREKSKFSIREALMATELLQRRAQDHGRGAKAFSVRLSSFEIDYCPFIGYQHIDSIDPSIPIGAPGSCEIEMHFAGQRMTLRATADRKMNLGEFARVADELQREDKNKAFEIQIREVEADQNSENLADNEWDSPGPPPDPTPLP